MTPHECLKRTGQGPDFLGSDFFLLATKQSCGSESILLQPSPPISSSGSRKVTFCDCHVSAPCKYAFICQQPYNQPIQGKKMYVCYAGMVLSNNMWCVYFMHLPTCFFSLQNQMQTLNTQTSRYWACWHPFFEEIVE